VKIRSNRVWYTLDVASNLRPVTSTATNAWTIKEADVRRVDGGVQVRSNGVWYGVVDSAKLTGEDHQYEVIDLGQGNVVRAERQHVSTGSVGFKRLPNEAPLFPSPPTAADIKQLNLGDCYLQAVLISIATQNPAHLNQMMRDNGDGSISVRFYAVDETNPQAPAFAAEDIRVEKSLPETATGQALYQGGAIWARLMQKAFAAFAQRHGQYGVAYQPSRGAGFSQIVSGVSYRLYGVFYGPARQAAGFDRTAYDPAQPAAANLQANAEVIKKLLQFAGQDRSLTGAGQVMNLTVGATLKAHVERAAGVIGRVQAAQVPAEQRALWGQLANNLPIIAGRLREPRYANVDATQAPQMNLIIRDARLLAEALRPWATANQHDADISAVYELLNDIKEAGSDTSEGQRFAYSGHAYAVVRVRFMPRTPDPQNLTNEALAAINIDQTIVTLRNPHGTNVPNAYGAAQNDTGEFDLTLAQFLRNFSEVEYGLARATR
jgi:hypothetical protein